MSHFVVVVIGAEHDPTALIIDYEEYNKTITIYKETNYYELHIDTIDDDIVELEVKYFDIEIDETSLPYGVSVGRIGTTRINIMDDDGNHLLLCCVIV